MGASASLGPLPKEYFRLKFNLRKGRVNLINCIAKRTGILMADHVLPLFATQYGIMRDVRLLRNALDTGIATYRISGNPAWLDRFFYLKTLEQNFNIVAQYLYLINSFFYIP